MCLVIKVNLSFFVKTAKPCSSIRVARFDPATKLCLSCHEVAAESSAFGRSYVRHPVGIPATKPGRILNLAQLPPLADVKGTSDPLDDVINCITCHYPHASANSFLLRWSIAELSSACLKCHPEVAPGETGLMVRR
jgi:predicted CXXCH cytochrome family protein